MLQETDLSSIREIVKDLVYLPIKQIQDFPPMYFVAHPFLSSCMMQHHDKWCNLLEDSAALEEWQQFMETLIDQLDLSSMFSRVRKGYRLGLLKICEKHLSQKDLSKLLADVWISSEDPNQDPNCSITYLVKLFRKCDPALLMVEEDYKVYLSLPEEFQVYRGVAVGRNPKGLSWTGDLETAEWFSHRFDHKGNTGYVLTAMVKKSDVLAYFNSRNENEIVCNVNSLKIME